MKVREYFIIISILIATAVIVIAQFWFPIIWSFLLIGPLIILGLFDVFQTKHTIRRNFPLIGRFRYILESIRPEIMQYFVETDTQGRPLNRILRSLVYRRAKGENDTEPFGTQMDLYHSGYEWLEHSMYAKHNPKEIEELLKIDNKKIFSNLKFLGNTVSSTIPFALKEADKKKIIKNNDTLILSGFGVGLSWGSCIIKWKKLN